MIYFLVNNNYHVDLDIKLAKELVNYDLGLIQVPYSLNVLNDSDVFSSIHTFEERLITSFKNILFRSNKIKNLLNKVDVSLNISKSDVLLVHTDMDLLNQYIIQKFYYAGARIYIVEDGIATITQFNMKQDRAAIKDVLRCFILKFFYGFKYLDIIKYGMLTQPVMKDYIFNGVIVNFGDGINREIPLYKLIPNQKQIKILHEKGAIFFNQPLYLFYLTEENYLNFIIELLKRSSNFSVFYFKFHPSDSYDFKVKMTEIINSKFENVTILLENEIAEVLVFKYPVRYGITISSTSVFNLMNSGVVPIYLNNLLNDRFPNKGFDAFSIFLESINCYSPKKMDEVMPNFVAFTNMNKNKNSDVVSLIDILN